uniref:Uncharacterized protein n=1 Tax=Fagus sylvatica TaxID=28930 RepID=A0A2N9E3X9_FAGSY
MAPGSRGAGAVFVCFSGEDSGQTGDATGEPRVARRSRSHYLSNAPGLAGSTCCDSRCRIFDVLGTVGKLALPNFARFRIRGNPSLGSRDMVPRTEAAGVFLVRLRTVFRSGFRLDPVKFLAIREFHVVHECVFFPTCPGLRINLLRVRKTLCASVATSVGNSGIFSTALFRRPVFTRVVDVAPDIGFRRSWYRRKACATYFSTVQALHRGELGFARYDLANGGRWNVPYAKGFDHNSLVSRPFLARKVSNRSSHHVLQNGQGAVSSIQLLVWSTVWSNLGQTWSTWSKLSELWEMYPGPRFEGFSLWWDPIRVKNGSVKSWSNSVNLGQTWSNLVPELWEMCPGPSSWRLFRMWRALVRIRTGLGSGCLVLRADTRENPVGKNGVMTGC